MVHRIGILLKHDIKVSKRYCGVETLFSWYGKHLAYDCVVTISSGIFVRS